MAKTMHVRPGQRVVVAGPGRSSWSLPSNCSRAGMEVLAVVEAARMFRFLGQLPRLFAHFGLLWEGLGYLRRLRARKYRFCGAMSWLRLAATGKCVRS